MTFPVLIGQLADRFESAPALRDPSVTLSYRALADRINRYARWARAEHLAPGETICLLMENCAEYLAIWLGLTRAGITVALINTNLTGDALAHSIRIVTPRAIIVGAGFGDRIDAIRPLLNRTIACWQHGQNEHPRLPRIDQALASLPSPPLDTGEFAPPSLKDRALYIYTSGTTGLPKAAIVSHFRVMQWTHWFCGLMAITPQDCMYDCLPLYHSVGGVVAAGAPLVAGASVVLRERFSASRFWQEVTEERCTLFQYIGELCRYLLASPQQDDAGKHSIRLACGNGLREDVWVPFQKRFRIPQILEYYASTEGNVSLYNCEGKPGSIGRVPPMLAHRYPIAIVRVDPITDEPMRDQHGRCIPCAPNEPGEALGQILADPEHAQSAFDGYVDTRANDAKVLRDVIAEGDSWYRTGDLIKRDEKGFYYFVDRIGQTFRWKGENVSTTEVASLLNKCTGVVEATVYGVRVPGAEGRAGMAAIVIDSTFNLGTFRQEVTDQLPAYARPLFLRIVPSLDRTGTFKLQTRKLLAQGYNPAQIDGALYFYSGPRGYITLDVALYQRLTTGTVTP
jgi:fatty-acyl-CoA synthase